jgi:surface carbohydrate biosynthesis protein
MPDSTPAQGKRIALIVDNPYRDLPGVVLLGMALCQRGARVFLAPMNLINREIWSLAPDYVVLNYLRSNNQRLVEHFLKAGMQVGVLDTEGGVFSSLETYERLLAPDGAIRHAVDDYFSWGPRMAQEVVERDWFLPDQVTITGHPRFSYYVAPWRQAALRASPYADGLPLPLVLINSNYPVVNPAFKTPEEEARMLVEKFGFDEEFVRGWVARQQQTLDGMAALANRLAERFPQVTFVYRPHPFEKVETYHRLLDLDTRPNLHLIKRGAVDGWILRASAVIQRSCSTAIESAIAGVPALSPVWLPTGLEQQTAESVSVPCASEEEMAAHVEAALSGDLALPPEVQASLDRVIADWFYKMDGEAHDRVAGAVAGTLQGKARAVSLDYCREGAYGMLDIDGGSSWKNRVRSLARKVPGLPIDWSFKLWRNLSGTSEWDNSEKHFDLVDVRRMVEAVQPIAREVYGEGWCDVEAQTAKQAGDYHFGYLRGRSVTLSTD